MDPVEREKLQQNSTYPD